MTDYWDVDALSAVYLEDSYVLDIVEEPSELSFRLNIVLTEQHPAYRPPQRGEQHRYADGWLILPGVTRTKWESRSTQRYTDATREEDLGNIDFMQRVDDQWLIGGDWGEVRVHTMAEPQLVLTGPW